LSSLAIAVEICPADKLPTELKITHSRITANPVVGKYYNQIDITTKLEWYNQDTGERGPLPSRRIAFEISLMRNFSKEVCAGGGEGCNIFVLESTSEDAIFFRTTSEDGSTRIIIDLDQVFGPATDTDPSKISYSITATYDPKGGVMTPEGVKNDVPYMGSSDTATYTPSSLPLINIMACFPIILVLGLLMAAMQVAGRNPFGYLDFSRVAFRTPSMRRRGTKGITIGTPTVVGKALSKGVKGVKAGGVWLAGKTIGRAFRTSEGKYTKFGAKTAELGLGIKSVAKSSVNLVGKITTITYVVSAARGAGKGLAWMGRQMKAIMGKKGKLLPAAIEDTMRGIAQKKGAKELEVRDNLWVQNIKDEVRINQAIKEGNVKFSSQNILGDIGLGSGGLGGGARMWSLSTQTALASGFVLPHKELLIDEDVKDAVEKGNMSPKAAAKIISQRNTSLVKARDAYIADGGNDKQQIERMAQAIDNGKAKVEAYTNIHVAAEMGERREKLEKSLAEAVSGSKGTAAKAESTLDSWMKQNAPIERALELAAGSGIISKEKYNEMKLSMAEESSTSLNAKLRNITNNALKDKSAPEEKIKAANLMAESLDAYESNAAKINAKALNLARSNDVISASEATGIGKMPLEKQEKEIEKLVDMARKNGKENAANKIEAVMDAPKTLGDAERKAGEAYHALPALFAEGSERIVLDTAGRIAEINKLDYKNDRLKDEIDVNREALENAVGKKAADSIIRSMETSSSDELNDQLKKINGYSSTMAAATAMAKYDTTKSTELLEKLRDVNKTLTPAEQSDLRLLTEASKSAIEGIKNARGVNREFSSGNEVMSKAFEKNGEISDIEKRVAVPGGSAAKYSKKLEEKIEGFESAIGESKS
jgi:hypothetical protein